MSLEPELVAELRQILGSRFRMPREDELRDDLDLGPPGFGLDSIALIELLLVCEEHFGMAFPFTLFDEGPITVGRLLNHARQAGRQSHAE